jgi:hypothetical protein
MRRRRRDEPMRREVSGIKINRLTWDSVGWAVNTLIKGLLIAAADSTHPADRPGVYAPPRSGLPLAVGLSHAFEIPVLYKPRAGCLWVDALYESGGSIDTALANFDSLLPAVWLGRHGCPVLRAREIADDVWPVFPWEQVRFAEANARAYAQRLRKLRKSTG